jgi:hypothetical protein
VVRVVVVVALGASGVLASLFYFLDQVEWAIFCGLVGVGLGALDVLDVIKPRSLFENDEKITEATMGTLISPETLRDIENHLNHLESGIEQQQEDELRMTVHLAVRRNDCKECHGQDKWSLLQLVDYVGRHYTRQRYGKRRVFPVSKGIIGRGFRTGEQHTVNFENDSIYRNRMVGEFGYLPNEAQYDRKKRYSYLCWPLSGREAILSMIYIDAHTPNFFPVDVNEIQNKDDLENASREIIALLENDGRVGKARATSS